MLSAPSSSGWFRSGPVCRWSPLAGLRARVPRPDAARRRVRPVTRVAGAGRVAVRLAGSVRPGCLRIRVCAPSLRGRAVQGDDRAPHGWPSGLQSAQPSLPPATGFRDRGGRRGSCTAPFRYTCGSVRAAPAFHPRTGSGPGPRRLRGAEAEPPITTPWPVPCASTRTSWVRKRRFCVGGAGKADWSARRIGVLPATERGSPTVIKCSQLSVLPSRFGCMRTSARAESAGHARYTFRVRVSKTARGALEAEWDRCRWLWNECVAKSKAMYLHNKATGGSAGRCSSRTCCRRRLPARRGCVRVHAFLFSS